MSRSHNFVGINLVKETNKAVLCLCSSGVRAEFQMLISGSHTVRRWSDGPSDRVEISIPSNLRRLTKHTSPLALQWRWTHTQPVIHSTERFCLDPMGRTRFYINPGGWSPPPNLALPTIPQWHLRAAVSSVTDVHTSPPYRRAFTNAVVSLHWG